VSSFSRRFANLRSLALQFHASGESYMVSIPSRILRLAGSLGAVAGIVAVCAFIRHVHVATVVLALLLAILIIANRWGFGEAAVATGLGALLLDYFFLPRRGLRIESTEYWVVFSTFLAVALVTSHLAARAKHQALAAAARSRELEKLYAFAQDLPMGVSTDSMVARFLDCLVRAFESKAAAFYDHSTGRAIRSGSEDCAIPLDRLRDTFSHPDLSIDKQAGTFLMPIRLGGQVVGSLGTCGGCISQDTFRAIVERMETDLEKSRALQRTSEAEAARRGQEIKSAVLDSLIHEVKTPLSVIKTAVSSLLSTDSDASNRHELLTIINEEADWLDISMSEVFWTANVEAGILKPERVPHDVRQFIDSTVESLRSRLSATPCQLAIPDSLPKADFDFHMIKGVLKELLNNALKYSSPGSPLAISAELANNEIVISLKDSGPGVPGDVQSHIFEKHYRGSVAAPGKGLGLALAKTIVEANGGRIGVTSQARAGSVFYFSLPVSQRDAA
jgi:two-component system sensor histidine kinase KdpD